MNRKERRRLKKQHHNYFTKKYPSRRAREAARKLLWPHDYKKKEKKE
jgi:hypothetical protein